MSSLPEPPEGFAVSTSQSGDDALVVVSGELDVAGVPEVRAALDAQEQAGRPTVVDLSRVTFLDSTGLGVLVHAGARAPEAGWSLRFVAPEAEAVRRLLELVDVGDRLEWVGAAPGPAGS